MGEVIRKSAAVRDIISDVRDSHTNSIARQGIWQQLAEERFTPVLKIVDSVDAQLTQAEQDAAPVLAALDAEDDRADRVIGKVSDDVWNAVGRPAWAVEPARYPPRTCRRGRPREVGRTPACPRASGREAVPEIAGVLLQLLLRRGRQTEHHVLVARLIVRRPVRRALRVRHPRAAQEITLLARAPCAVVSGVPLAAVCVERVEVRPVDRATPVDTGVGRIYIDWAGIGGELAGVAYPGLTCLRDACGHR